MTNADVIKERFIKRYKKAIRDYFKSDYADDCSRIIKNYIMNEYEKILEEEFQMKHDDVASIYQAIYEETYFDEEE